MSINHPLTNITFARAEPSLDYFQHLKLHAHVFVVFVLSPSPQCQNIGLGGGGEHIYIYIEHGTFWLFLVDVNEAAVAAQQEQAGEALILDDAVINQVTRCHNVIHLFT